MFSFHFSKTSTAQSAAHSLVLGPAGAVFSEKSTSPAQAQAQAQAQEQAPGGGGPRWPRGKQALRRRHGPSFFFLLFCIVKKKKRGGGDAKANPSILRRRTVASATSSLSEEPAARSWQPKLFHRTVGLELFRLRTTLRLRGKRKRQEKKKKDLKERWWAGPTTPH